MTTPSELFALSQGQKCQGDQRCHWCGAPCTRDILHDDTPPIPFVRSTSYAKVYSSPYCCTGCYLWRMNSRTVTFLPKNGEVLQKDRQSAKHHSWLLTPKDAFALKPYCLTGVTDPETVFSWLLKPTTPFTLMLRHPRSKTDVVPQLGAVNEGEVANGTRLLFTLDNVRHDYSVYELKMTLETGETDGKSAGVRVLFEAFGPYSLPVEKKDKGRPSDPRGNAKQILDAPVTKGRR